MQLHDKIKNILEKSDIIKKYDAIGIITVIMIIGWIIDAAMILKWCQSPKGIALIIKNGGPLVKLFVRRNIYKKCWQQMFQMKMLEFYLKTLWI